jgi:PST family polysaccharide transporter
MYVRRRWPRCLETFSMELTPDGKNIQKRVAKNLSALFVIRGINIVIPLVALPYILKTVGIENYGVIAFSLAFATFFGAIIQYGFGISAVRDIARVREDHAQVSKIFSATFITMLLIALSCTVVYVMIVMSVESLASRKLVYFGSLMLVAGNALFPHWLFLGLERSYLAAVITLSIRLGYLGLLFLFVREPQDYVLVHALNGATAMVGVLSGLGIAFGVIGLKFVFPPVSYLWETLREGFLIFLIQFAPNLYNNSLVFILGLVAIPGVVGLFSVANSIVEVVISLGRMLSNAFLPVLTNTISIHSKYTKLMFGLGLSSMVAVILLADPITAFLSRTNSAELANTIRFIAVSIPMIAGYLAFNNNYLIITGHEKLAAKITVITSLCGMMLACILVPLYSITGAISVLIVVRLALFIVSYQSYRHVGS